MNQAHGAPYDRGSADRYYGRQFAPHYYLRKFPGQGSKLIGEDMMTDEEIYEYKVGWNNCICRKDWGDGLSAPEQSDVPLMDIRDYRD